MSELRKIVGPPYKGTQGHWLTKSLFHGIPVHLEEPYEPIFHLDEVGKIFVDLRDPTGYKWAIQVLGSWEHFTVLREQNWFRPHLEKWIHEIDTIFTSEAVERVRKLAEGDSAQALPAAKYLAEKGWEKLRGRPSKAEMNRELKKQVKIIDDYDEDAKRLNLSVINGGKK